MRRILLLPFLIASALFATHSLRAQPPTLVMGAPYHDPARAFIDLMIPHLESGIMMSEHAGMAARSDSVKAMARRMSAERQREVAGLRAARRALFGSDSARNPMMRVMMQMMGMHGMRDTAATHAMMDTMQQHQAAPGVRPDMMSSMMSGDIDRMYLEHMMLHLADGMDISVLAEDSRAVARVRQLARNIRERQERDVAEMRRLLAKLPATRSDRHRD